MNVSFTHVLGRVLSVIVQRAAWSGCAWTRDYTLLLVTPDEPQGGEGGGGEGREKEECKGEKEPGLPCVPVWDVLPETTPSVLFPFFPFFSSCVATRASPFI